MYHETVCLLQGHFTVGMVGSKAVGDPNIRVLGSSGAMLISTTDSSLHAYGEGGKVIRSRQSIWVPVVCEGFDSSQVHPSAEVAGASRCWAEGHLFGDSHTTGELRPVVQHRCRFHCRR